MRKAMNLILLGGLSLLALAGCNKEGLEQKYSRAAGEEIVFGAVTRSFNPMTKTAYSGEKSGTKERINWVVGDQFRVYSDKAVHRYNGNSWADYQIMKAPTNNGAESVVTFGVNSDPGIAPITEYKLKSDFVSKNGLVWGTATDYTFYAAYPPVEGTVAADGATGSFTMTMPDTQELTAHSYTQHYAGADATSISILEPDMKNAFMTAAKKVTTNKQDEGVAVELAFGPAYTAFQFQISSDKNMTVKGFHMTSTSTPLSGAFTANGTSANKWTYTANGTISENTPCDINVEFTTPIELKLANAEAEETNTAYFTVFALPTDLKDIQIVFDVVVDEEEQTRRLDLTYAADGKTIEFGGTLKHYLKGMLIPGVVWKYTFNPAMDKWTDVSPITLYI